MRLILRFLKPHWKLCLATVLLMIVDIVGVILIPTFAGEMLNISSMSGASEELLLATGIKMTVVAVISGICAIIGAYICATLTSRIGKGLRDALYKKTLKLSVSDFRSFGTASVTTRTVSDVTSIQFALLSFLQMVLPVPVIFIASLVLAFSMDWVMGLIFLSMLVIISIVAFFIMRSASPLFRRQQKLLDRMSTVLLENITGVRVVRAFNKETSETDRLNGAFNNYKTTSIKANRLYAALDGISILAINVFIILVYGISGQRIVGGWFEIGDIAALVECAFYALFYIMMAQMVILTLPRALECCNRIETILDLTPQITDNPNAEKPCLQHGKNVLEFDRVSFRFPNADEYSLKELNFACRRGETTAIIGGTGSGKSTIASLILRFNEVTDGALRFDGIDIRNLPQKQLRDNLAYVQQRAWLFAGTIADNLRYGNPQATDEELWKALEVAQAEEFVRSLPDGLNSFVAQGGTNFSGGQKQRLSIARALVKRPELYIFDDSLSALDFKTDAALRKALANETRDVAVVIIAQRISSIRHAEQIVVLNEGEAVGIGTHDELIKSCSVYREIYESQTKEADER